jgi:seryl-tRNA synthetase
VLDIRLIRSDPESVRAALARRGHGIAELVDQVLALDGQWRELTTELEGIRAEQNAAHREMRGAPNPEQRAVLAELARRGRATSDAETSVRADRDTVLLALPNLPSPAAPHRYGSARGRRAPSQRA